jgi:hypothetical protein
VSSVNPSEPIFTLLSDPNVGNGAVNWLIIHNADGKVIAAQKFTPGDGVVASSNATKEGDFINVTLMQYNVGPGLGGYNYSLTSYLNIPLHETWTTQPAPAQNGTYLGTFNVTSTGFPLASRINISNVYGVYTLLTFDGSFTSQMDQSPVFSNTKNYFFSCSYPQGNLSYKFLPNVQAGDNYTIGPADLQPAESSIQVPLTQMNNYTLVVMGVTASESLLTSGYIVHNDYGESPLPASVSIWFPDLFTSFRTTLGMTNGNGTYYFQSVGPKPSTNIVAPTSQVYKISNRTIQNFQYVGNEDFQQRTSVWEYHDKQQGTNPELPVDIVWAVHSPPGVPQKILELPSSFNTSYPDLKLESLIHTGTVFGLQGASTFADLINTSFKGQPPPSSQSWYSVRLN